jgi:hypothetical protein
MEDASPVVPTREIRSAMARGVVVDGDGIGGVSAVTRACPASWQVGAGLAPGRSVKS